MSNPWNLTLKNLFLPIFCRQCGCALLTEENGYFCPACWNVPERIERPFCSICGRPHKARIGFGPVENFPCDGCRKGARKAYGSLVAACDYDGAIAEAIKLLKFHHRPQLAGPLAEELLAFIDREISGDQREVYDALIPVPLHPVRRRSRGFNQAQLLAERLGHAFPNAVLDVSLRRIRPTRAQSSLTSPAQRKDNVRGAFAVDRERDFDGATVLLVDDVVTTGGTVEECARALRRAGAERVDVIAVAMPVVAPDADTPKHTPPARPRPRMRLGF